VAHERHVGDEIEQLRLAPAAKVHEELKSHCEEITAMEQQLAVIEVERRRVDDESDFAQDAARTLREALDLEMATNYR
jgi:hypothetical protein